MLSPVGYKFKGSPEQKMFDTKSNSKVSKALFSDYADADAMMNFQ